MPRQQWRRTRRQLASLQAWRTRVVFFLGAVAIGIIATALAYACDWAAEGFWVLVEDRPWLPFLLTPFGLMAIAWVMNTLFPAAEGSGIPQVIAMLKVKDPLIRDRVLGFPVGLGKSVLIAFGLLCGASIGREGPTIHVSAALSYSLARWSSLPCHVADRMILAGAAAGLAAAFNTPLAGFIFVIEEMSRGIEERTSGIVLTAVILAGVTAIYLQGQYYYFGTVDSSVGAEDLLAAALMCGLVGGFLGGAFSLFLISGTRKLSPLRGKHPYLFAGACGLALAFVGLSSNGLSYGTGYEEARDILDWGEGSIWYPFAKLLATLISYWSGIPGGIFSPTLSVGAGLGTLMGKIFTSTPIPALGLLCMAGYFSGVVRSPITALVIVMEMTNEHSMLLPIMGSALVADWVSRHICAEPIYSALAKAYLKRPENRAQKGSK